MYIKKIHTPEADLWNAVVDLAIYDIQVMNEYICQQQKYYKNNRVSELVENHNSAVSFFSFLKKDFKNDVDEALSKYRYVEKLHIVPCRKCKKHKIILAEKLQVVKKCLCLELI